MLGDLIHAALAAVGVTPDRVSRWLGKPCGCEARRQRLNQLTAWATRWGQGRTERSEEYLGRILGEDHLGAHNQGNTDGCDRSVPG